jgi:hypothetical protein
LEDCSAIFHSKEESFFEIPSLKLFKVLVFIVFEEMLVWFRSFAVFFSLFYGEFPEWGALKDSMRSFLMGVYGTGNCEFRDLKLPF